MNNERPGIGGEMFTVILYKENEEELIEDRLPKSVLHHVEIEKLGWILCGQDEYCLNHWTLEHAKGDSWRINDEDHQMMWFDITSKGELSELMRMIGIKK